MLVEEGVCKRTAHCVGGVCPFVNPEGVSVYLDISLKRSQTVFSVCGSANSAIELMSEKLEKYVHKAVWVDVCRLR